MDLASVLNDPVRSPLILIVNICIISLFLIFRNGAIATLKTFDRDVYTVQIW